MTEEKLKKIKELKVSGKKNKAFKTLSIKEKDELLETVCKILGFIES